jgi:hypothetical protein
MPPSLAVFTYRLLLFFCLPDSLRVGTLFPFALQVSCPTLILPPTFNFQLELQLFQSFSESSIRQLDFDSQFLNLRPRSPFGLDLWIPGPTYSPGRTHATFFSPAGRFWMPGQVFLARSL